MFLPVLFRLLTTLVLASSQTNGLPIVCENGSYLRVNSISLTLPPMDYFTVGVNLTVIQPVQIKNFTMIITGDKGYAGLWYSSFYNTNYSFGSNFWAVGTAKVDAIDHESYDMLLAVSYYNEIHFCYRKTFAVWRNLDKAY